MAIDFPNSPTIVDTFTVGNRTWEWNGTKWGLQTTAIENFTVSDTAPNSPTVGDLWFNSSNAATYIYYDSTWVEVGGATVANTGYQYVQTVYFTSSGTFTKATYPWLRAVRVRVQGGGGGGGAALATSATQISAGGGGGGGCYAESFILASSLSASVTVVAAAGGPGGTTGNGGTGGTSQFGTLVTANGGSGGGFARDSTLPVGALSGDGGKAGVGDVVFAGSGGTAGMLFSTNGGNGCFGGAGGSSYLGGGAETRRENEPVSDGNLYGGGGGGAAVGVSASAENGGAGAAGIVIVELYV
jgi:hypothetical protein